jgi:hypothetical protein
LSCCADRKKDDNAGGQKRKYDLSYTHGALESWKVGKVALQVSEKNVSQKLKKTLPRMTGEKWE